MHSASLAVAWTRIQAQRLVPRTAAGQLLEVLSNRLRAEGSQPVVSQLLGTPPPLLDQAPLVASVRRVRLSLPPALRAGANRLFQLPGFVPRVAGFWRAPVQIRDVKRAILCKKIFNLKLPGTEVAKKFTTRLFNVTSQDHAV